MNTCRGMGWVLATALGALPAVSAHAASYGLAFDGFKVSVVDLDPADGIAAGYDVIGQTMAYSAILGDSEAGFSSASGNGFVPFEPFDRTVSLRGATGRVRVAADSFSLQATESDAVPTLVWLELVVRNVYELRPNTRLDGCAGRVALQQTDQNAQYEQYHRPTKRDVYLATMEDA